jgi:hypothetical protein
MCSWMSMCAWTAATAEPISASSLRSNAAAAASKSASGTAVSETRVAVSAQARTAAFPVIEQRTATARTAYEHLINEQFVVGMGAAGTHVADSMAATPMTVPSLFEKLCHLANGRRRGCSG